MNSSPVTGLEIKEIDVIDEIFDDESRGFYAHCHITIGYFYEKYGDLFFADICNNDWFYKHRGQINDDEFLIVSGLSEYCIEESILERYNNLRYSSMEEFARIADPVLRWEFKEYKEST